MLTLTSLGAAGPVTGSKHLLTHDGYRILIDCGLFQGLKSLRELNWEKLPVHPREQTMNALWVPSLTRVMRSRRSVGAPALADSVVPDDQVRWRAIDSAGDTIGRSGAHCDMSIPTSGRHGLSFCPPRTVFAKPGPPSKTATGG